MFMFFVILLFVALCPQTVESGGSSSKEQDTRAQAEKKLDEFESKLGQMTAYVRSNGPKPEFLIDYASKTAATRSETTTTTSSSSDDAAADKQMQDAFDVIENVRAEKSLADRVVQAFCLGGNNRNDTTKRDDVCERAMALLLESNALIDEARARASGGSAFGGAQQKVSGNEN